MRLRFAIIVAWAVVLGEEVGGGRTGFAHFDVIGLVALLPLVYFIWRFWPVLKVLDRLRDALDDEQTIDR